MRLIRYALVGATLVLMVSGQSHAAMINVTYDLNTAVVGNTWVDQHENLAAPVTINNGESVTLEIDFLPGQALTWFGDGAFQPALEWTGIGADSGPFTTTNTTLTFENLVGSAFGPISDTSSGFAHLGPYIPGDGNVRTFTGISVSFIANFTDGDADRQYGAINFWPLFAGQVAAVEASPTPEPASMALLAMGGGILAFGRKRLSRRRKTAELTT